MSMGHFVLGAFCPWGKMSPNQQSVIIIAEALMALKMYFWDPHNEIKCVLSIIESYSIEKNGPNFSHLLTVRAEGADPPSPSPYGQPDCKIFVFYDFPYQSCKFESKVAFPS